MYRREEKCVQDFGGDLGKGKYVSKKAKLKLYWTIIRPVMTYGSETWALKQSME
jgi:hypothetical protein